LSPNAASACSAPAQSRFIKAHQNQSSATDAALGNKEAALQEGRRAMDLLPREKDATNGEVLFGYFAVIAAWAGEKDLALQQLNDAIPLPGATFITSYGILKLMPFWDPLRGDPRFEKIVQSLAPKQ
jgi:hypothetical protein